MGIEPPSHPGNVGVEKEIPSRRPFCGPAYKKDHLLPATELVDNSSGRSVWLNGIGSKLGDQALVLDNGRVPQY